MRASVILLPVCLAVQGLYSMTPADVQQLLAASAQKEYATEDERLDAFVDQSFHFLAKMPDGSPRLLKQKNLGAGSHADCVAAMVRTCMGLGLYAKLQQDQRNSLSVLELDHLDSQGRLFNQMHPRSIEPFSQESVAVVSRKNQARVWKFLTRAIQRLHKRDFLMTQRMYLWAIESDVLTDGQIERHNRYARRVCADLFTQLAKPEKQKQKSCGCAIL